MTVETREGAPRAAERWELRIGAEVYTTDDWLGKLRQVVVIPGEQRVAALVVRGGFPPREYLVPLAAVQEADEEQIQLSVTTQEVEQLGRYDKQAYHAPEWALAGYAPGEAVVSLRGKPRGRAAEAGTGPAGMAPIRVGLRVEAVDGAVGRVNRVLVNAEDGFVTHFVVHQGVLGARDLLVPVEWVSSVTADVVTLAATRSDVAALPEYHTDEELADKILNEWKQDLLLNALLIYSDVRVTVRDGIATLEGYAWTSDQRRWLEELAEQVSGVLEVRNEVVADDELALAVSRALAEDPRTRGHDITVQAYLGNIHLHGTAEDKASWAAAEEVAAQVPHVKAVINLMRVRPRP